MEVGAVIQASSDVEVNADEKEGGSICVEVTDKSAVVNVAADMGYG